MSVLDQVMNLKAQGVPTQEVIRRLQEEGISPGEISDALSKAQIKNAVSYNGRNAGMEVGMQSSILSNEEEPERLPLEGLEGSPPSDIDLTPPVPGGFPGQMMPMQSTREVSGESDTYEPQEQEIYYPQENLQQQPQENYYEYPQYAPSSFSGGVAGDTDTMIEVAEQVFSEKNKSIQKKIEEMSEFRTLAQTRIENVSDRLRRMEAIIDKLQASILEKIGSYGHGLETVRKEMSMMQDTFGKMINKVADASEHRHNIQHAPEHHVTVHKSKKVTRRTHKK